MTSRRDLPALDVMTSNVLDVLGRATAEDMAAGLEWYPTALETAEDLAGTFGLALDVAAGVLAVLSAGTEWSENVRAAYAACETWAVTGDVSAVRDLAATIASPAAGNNARRAALILSTGDAADARRSARTQKVHHFFRSITGDVDAPCIDRHATRAALGDVLGAEDRPSTDAAYHAIADAYRKAAAEAGMTPRDVQAVTWVVTVRERAEWRTAHAGDVL